MQAEVEAFGRKAYFNLTDSADLPGRIQGCWMRGSFYEAQKKGLLPFLHRRVSGGVMVDVGASIGNHTVFMATVLDADQVVAFEPYDKAREQLIANLTLNGIEDRVEVYAAALSDAPGAVDVVRDGWRLTVTDGAAVPAMRLDDLELWPCAYIKIDVDGFEARVLRGARETIRRCRPLVTVESVDTLAEVDSIMSGLDYIRDPVVLNHTPTYAYRPR